MVILSRETRKGQQRGVLQRSKTPSYATVLPEGEQIESDICRERGLCYNQKINALLREDDTSQTAGQSSKRNKHGEETLSLRED